MLLIQNYPCRCLLPWNSLAILSRAVLSDTWIMCWGTWASMRESTQGSDVTFLWLSVTCNMMHWLWKRRVSVSHSKEEAVTSGRQPLTTLVAGCYSSCKGVGESREVCGRLGMSRNYAEVSKGQNETKEGGHTSEMKRRSGNRKRTKLFIKEKYAHIKLSGESKCNGRG